MKLERLYIQGFKSFKDRTTINFDQGITGIVGPNGCGKSNIVDALFWVMGEQSAKHLRGTKMSDLIFSGSSKYSPAAFAEVSLVLLNTIGKHIHIGDRVVAPSEIQITRKLYRNGETEYRINDEPARLKDIQEVFMDTGAGAKSYSIIAQGEIDRLVRAKPEERRVMIEEVAGITKFKLRKKESMRKIEQTQLNLERLSDLEKEVYKQLKNLEKQAEKATKAKSLKEKIRNHELIVSSHKERDYLEAFAKFVATAFNNTTEIETLTAQKNVIDLSLEEEKNRKQDLMSHLDEAQADFNVKARELAAFEERLKSLARSIEEKNKFIVDKSQENETLSDDIASRSTRLAKIEEDYQKLLNFNPEEEDFSELEERVDALKEEVADLELELGQKKSEKENFKSEMASVENDIFRNQSRMEEMSKNLQEISIEMDSLETESSHFSETLVEKRENLKRLEKEYQDLKAKREKLESVVAKEKSLLEEKDQNFRKISKELISLEAKIHSFEEMALASNNKEDTNKIVEKYRSEGIALLGEVIEIDETYATATQKLLSAYVDSIISQNLGKGSLETWKGQDSLNLDWLISSENTQNWMEIQGNEISLAEQMKFKSGYQLDSKMFAGFYIIPDLTLENVDNYKNKNFVSMTNLEGTLTLRKFGQLVQIDLNEKIQAGQGLIERTVMLDKMKESCVVLKTKNEALETELQSLENSLKAHQGEFSFIDNAYNKTHVEYASLKSELLSQESGINSSQSRMQILQKKKQEISHLRIDLIEKEEIYDEKKALVLTSLDDVSDIIANQEEKLLNLKTQYEELRDELLEKRASSKTYQTQLDSYKSQIEDIKTQVSRYQDRKQKNIDTLENLNNELIGIEEEIKTLKGSNQQMAEELASEEEALSILKDQLSELLLSMQDREDEMKKISQKISQLEKEKMESELKMAQIKEDEVLLVKNIFDVERVDLRKELSRYLEISEDVLAELSDVSDMYTQKTQDGDVTLFSVPYEFDKKFPGQLAEIQAKLKENKQEISRLGEINWQAMEDYDRQKMRHEFLASQSLELQKSLEDLTTAIMHIDQKSVERFQEAFTEVNQRFVKVFPIIFGGGSARLELTGKIDDPESGVEIIAQPPGKKMQNINLMSGGEKAMTAVSLIFSIFLVKPSPFCLLDEVDAPLDDANVGRFNELLREMSTESQFILITHNKKTMELNDTLYGVTMQEPGVSKAISVQLH